MVQLELPMRMPAPTMEGALARLVECVPGIARVSESLCVAQFMAPDESAARGVRLRPRYCIGCKAGLERAAKAGLVLACACPTCGGSGRVLRDAMPMAGGR